MSGITIIDVKKVDEEMIKKMIENKPVEIKCTFCQYDGSDLEIGRNPISNPMMCSKCKRYFYPLNQLSKEHQNE